LARFLWNAGDQVELASVADGCFLRPHKKECCLSLVTLLFQGLRTFRAFPEMPGLTNTRAYSAFDQLQPLAGGIQFRELGRIALTQTKVLKNAIAYV
jgi:hypothetical protein